jgi:hypothetical protein
MPDRQMDLNLALTRDKRSAAIIIMIETLTGKEKIEGATRIAE